MIITVPAKDSPDYQRIRMWQKCLAKGAKIMNSKNQNVNIKIRSYDDLYKVLACPKCRKDSHKNGNYFFCDFCGVKYPLKEGTPFLTVTDAIKTLR